MPSLFSRKSKQTQASTDHISSDNWKTTAFPNEAFPTADEYGRLVSQNASGSGRAGPISESRPRKGSKPEKSSGWGGRRDRRGTGGSAEGVREAEKERDRIRSTSGPPKVQFAPPITAQYPDLPRSQTSQHVSRSGNPSGVHPILKNNDSRPQPSDRRSGSERYTFLPTRFPLLGRTLPNPHLETTLISSHGPRTGSSSHRYPTQAIPPSSTYRTLNPSGSWVGVIKGDYARQGAGRYGYLNVEAGLVIGLHEMIGAVEVAVKELTDRGLTTPRLFSSKALDLSSNRITLLIQSYIRTLSHAKSSTSNWNTPAGSSSPRGGNTATATWQRDMQLASPIEVAWFLRWVLARAVRINLELVRDEREGPGVGGGRDRRAVEGEPEWVEKEYRGLLEWEDYEIWRGRERGSEYDKTHFQTFLRSLPPSLAFVVQPLFTLFSHFAAYSHDSGMTPGAISALFGPLLFGCGAPSCSFDEAHAAFVRSAGATEHLILSFIRFQAAGHDRLKGQFPGNLTNWIKGYPRMLITDRELDLGLPRKGLRVIKVERARRMVRAYSPDLIRSGQTWAGEMMRERKEIWPEWEETRVPEERPRPTNPYLPQVSEDVSKELPLLTEDHKKRLNVDGPVILPRGMGSALSTNTLSSDSSVGTLSVRTPQLETSESDAFASVVDRDWRLFEGNGFDNDGLVSHKLNFDLQESVRQETLNDKRRTMTWDDFAAPAGGFTKNSSGLDATLIFSPPVRQQREPWPGERDEIQRKLKKAHKESPANFQGWDTSPALVASGEGIEVIEEAFVDVAVDLLLSSGWTDCQELTHRPANWVLMEYRTMPNASRAISTTPTHVDPRTAFKLFLFEEFVPLSYQRDLVAPEQKRGGFFSRNRGPKKTSHDSAGSGRTIRTRDEAEFDAAIRRGVETRVMALSKPVSYISNAPLDGLPPGTSATASETPYRSRSGRKSAAGDPPRSPAAVTGQGNHSSRPGLMGRISGRRVRSRPDIAEDRLFDETIETRTTSAESSTEGNHSKAEPKLESDKWIDILVASGAKRMDTQSAPQRPAKDRKPQGSMVRSPFTALDTEQDGRPLLKATPTEEAVPAVPAVDIDPSASITSSTSRNPERPLVRKPLFASSLALDKVSPHAEFGDAEEGIEPSTPEAEHPEQYAYAYSPESSRAVPEMQAVRDRSQTMERVLHKDSFHQPAGSIHSQSALEILNAASGGAASLHGSQEIPLAGGSPNQGQMAESPLTQHSGSNGPLGVAETATGVVPSMVTNGPPMLEAPLPISPKSHPGATPARKALPAAPQHSTSSLDDDLDVPNANRTGRRDTLHSIMDRYGFQSPYDGGHGHGRSDSEDLPPLPKFPTADHAILAQLRPGFMRPDVPSQYDSYGSRDSYVSAPDQAPAMEHEDAPHRPGQTGIPSGIDMPRMFTRDKYEYEDSPVDPAIAPDKPPREDECRSFGTGSGVGSIRTKFGRSPWESAGTESNGAVEALSHHVTRQPPAVTETAASPARLGTGVVGTLASRFENAGRQPPPPISHDKPGAYSDVSEYRTAPQEPQNDASPKESSSEEQSERNALLVPEERYHFEPPPTLADIEAIARRPSPGRVEHGLNLGFVPEEDEEEQDDGESVDHMEDRTGNARAGEAIGRKAEDALGLRDAGAKEIGSPGASPWEVEKMNTPDRKLRRR